MQYAAESIVWMFMPQDHKKIIKKTLKINENGKWLEKKYSQEPISYHYTSLYYH